MANVLPQPRWGFVVIEGWPGFPYRLLALFPLEFGFVNEMSLSMSQNRKIGIAGAIALAIVAIVAIFIWIKRPAAQLKAPSQELLEKLIAAGPDHRDDFIIELGRRGPQIIPLATAAYEKAPNDPELRTQLVIVISRTNSPSEAVPALERLLQKEKEPRVRNTIQNSIAGLQRFRNAAP